MHWEMDLESESSPAPLATIHFHWSLQEVGDGGPGDSLRDPCEMGCKWDWSVELGLFCKMQYFVPLKWIISFLRLDLTTE